MFGRVFVARQARLVLTAGSAGLAAYSSWPISQDQHRFAWSAVLGLSSAAAAASALLNCR
jgi:hypothetical protein